MRNVLLRLERFTVTMKSGSFEQIASKKFSTVEGVTLSEKNGKELRKIDWHIVKRLVVFLYYDGKTKRTNIATRCNLGYDKCIRYLDWMKKMDLISNEHDKEGFELVSLNEKGMEIYKNNFKEV